MRVSERHQQPWSGKTDPIISKFTLQRSPVGPSLRPKYLLCNIYVSPFRFLSLIKWAFNVHLTRWNTWLFLILHFEQAVLQYCLPTKQCQRASTFNHLTDDIDWYCKLMEAWSSRTERLSSGPQMAISSIATLYPKRMREPLQFVISNSGFLYDPARRRLWIAESTHSRDKSLWYNTCMIIQDDGNLVIHDRRTGKLCWARSGFVPGRLSKPRRVNILFEDVEIRTWAFSLPPL
jgi:hypothetical protein